MTFKRIIILIFILAIVGLVLYYFYPITKIPSDIIIDKIVVMKASHELLAFSKGKLVVTYKIAIGKNPIGDKEYEGDQKTPRDSM